MPQPAPFGHWLQRQMNRLDTNLTTLAGQVGVSHVSVSRWMSGAAAPNPENVKRLARVLGVPETEIYVALGHLPPDTETALSEPKRRLIYKIRKMKPEDLAVVESVVDQFLARQAPELQRGARRR